MLCFVKIRTSATSNSQRRSGPQSSLSLVGLRNSGMRQPRCPRSTNLCYHIPMPSSVVFKSIFARQFVIYHLALICASSTDFLLLIKSWLSIIIDLTNPPSILYLGHAYVCVIFDHALAHIPAVLDPRITYKGLKLDFKNDPVLLVDLDKSKSRLREYYNKYYVVSPAPPRDTNNACPKLSSTSDFTACYESIIPDSINKLDEYLKIKHKDFKKCNPLRWWRSQCEDWPNLVPPCM